MLTAHNIPYWVDREIEAGTAWREEIDTALENAFAVAVILTNQTMYSPYVTYEWSWALGHGIPVIPLAFEDLSEEELHPRLNALQRIECYPDLPQTIIEVISNHQKGSSLTSYIEQRISDTVLPLRFLVKTLFWLQSYCLSNGELLQAYWMFVFALILEIGTLKNEKLSNLWLEYSHSFTKMQRRDFQKLSDELNSIAPLFVDLQGKIPNQPYFETVVKRWQQDFEAALKLFDGYDNYFYRFFENFLSAYSANSFKLDDRQTQQLVSILDAVVFGQAPIPDQVKQLVRQAIAKVAAVSGESL